MSVVTTTPTGPTEPVSAEGIRRVALIAGAAGLVLAAVGGLAFKPALFFQSYLWAFLACLGLVLGSQVLLMIQYLTGGRWGFLLRRIFEANTRCMPLVTLFFVPLLFGLQHLFPWAFDGATAEGGPLHAKAWYLYTGLPMGFIPRAVLYFAFWNALTWTFNRWSLRLDENPTQQLRETVTAVSGLGIVAYAVSILFAATDWAMSLEPEWYSTMYPPLLGMGQILLAHAFGIIVLLLLGNSGPLGLPGARAVQRDVGNLLLAFVMLFTYMAFSQFLLIYSGNLPEEIPYFITRKEGGWGVLISLVGLFLFATPFLLLLQRDVKKNPNALLTVAALVFVMRLADLYWQIIPAFGGEDFTKGGGRGHFESGGLLTDVAVLVGLGGLYLAFFLWQLGQRPLVARYGAEQMEEVAQHG